MFNFQFSIFNQKQGFTMVEMIVTMSVVVILLAALVPVLSQYLPGTQLAGATRVLAGNLREAQEKAVSEQDQYLIRFLADQSPPKYQLIKIRNSVEEQIREVLLPATAILNLAATITNNQIVFSPDGGPSSSGNVTITINGQAKIINVSPAGFIKIE